MKYLSLILVLLTIILMSSTPMVKAGGLTQDLFNRFLEQSVQLEQISEAGERIQLSGTRMRRSTYLSIASGGLYSLGLLLMFESPEAGSLVILAAGGLALWSWIEGFLAQGDLREGGRHLKEAVNP